MIEADERACDQAGSDAEELLRRTEGDLAALRAAGEVPTFDVLTSARERRDHGWRVIRRRHLDGVDIADEEMQAFAPAGDLEAEAGELSNWKPFEPGVPNA